MAILIKCKNCKKKFLISPSRIGIKKFCSMKCYIPKRIKAIKKSGKKYFYKKGNIPYSYFHPEVMPKGKNHHLWKAAKVGYRGLHYWLERQKGKPKFCVKCGTTKGRIQWANKDGKYRRVLTDYKSMCPSCHKLHDLKLRKKK